MFQELLSKGLTSLPTVYNEINSESTGYRPPNFAIGGRNV